MMLLTTANPTPVIKETFTIPTAHAEVVEQVIDTVEAPKLSLDDTIGGNCYKYLKTLIPNLPRAREIVGNSIAPVRDGVLILQYDNLIHYAYIESVSEEGIHVKESNYIRGQLGERDLSWKYLKDHRAEYYRLPEASP